MCSLVIIVSRRYFIAAWLRSSSDKVRKDVPCSRNCRLKVRGRRSKKLRRIGKSFSAGKVGEQNISHLSRGAAAQRQIVEEIVAGGENGGIGDAISEPRRFVKPF